MLNRGFLGAMALALLATTAQVGAQAAKSSHPPAAGSEILPAWPISCCNNSVALRNGSGVLANHWRTRARTEVAVKQCWYVVV